MTKKYNTEYVEKIKDIIAKHPKNFACSLKSKKTFYLYQYILDATKEFDIPFNTRVYWITNEIYDFPKCIVCGRPMPKHTLCHYIKGYRTMHCCQSCAQKDPEYRKMVEQHNLEKYGETSPCKSEAIRKKISNNWKNFSSEKKAAIRKKTRKTNLERYGVEVVSQNKEIIEKIKTSFANRSIEEKAATYEKTCKTRLERYGDPHYINVEQVIRTRTKNFNENPELKEEWLRKRYETNL